MRSFVVTGIDEVTLMFCLTVTTKQQNRNDNLCVHWRDTPGIIWTYYLYTL